MAEHGRARECCAVDGGCLCSSGVERREKGTGEEGKEGGSGEEDDMREQEGEVDAPFGCRFASCAASRFSSAM